MLEIWKDIQGFEGVYQVSNLGNVKSLFFHSTNTPRLLKSSPTNCGYYKVQLHLNGKPKTKYVHRLVAETFLPRIQGKDQVNHKDGDKSNNALQNLEWVSASENQLHSVRNNLRKSSPMLGRFGSLNPRSKPISQYALDGTFIRRWNSVSDAGRYYNFRPNCISECANGITHTSYGYIWKYD